MKRDTSLHYAIVEGDYRVIRATSRADHMAALRVDKRGLTPLDVAIMEDAPRALALLLEALCSGEAEAAAVDDALLQSAMTAIDYSSSRCLNVALPLLAHRAPHMLHLIWPRLACYEGFSERYIKLKLLYIMSYNDDCIDGRDDEGDTALTYNAGWGRVGRINTLLSLGCDPNQVDSDHDSPLVWAACSARWEAVSLLLKAGAVAARGPRGLLGAPLHQAARVGSMRMVRLLLDAGADPDERDVHGCTFVEIARDAHARHQQLRRAAPKIIIERSRGEDLVTLYQTPNSYVIHADAFDAILKQFA